MSPRTSPSPDNSRATSRATSPKLTTSTSPASATAPSDTLAYGRIDWTVAPNSDVFFEAGQDWSIFGSSAMMNLFETTSSALTGQHLHTLAPDALGLSAETGRLARLEILPRVCAHDAVRGQSPGNQNHLPGSRVGSVAGLYRGQPGLASQIGYGERQALTMLNRKWNPERIAIPTGQSPRRRSGFRSFGRLLYRSTTDGALLRRSCGLHFGVSQWRRSQQATVYGNQFAVSLQPAGATFVASAYAGADMRFFFGGQTLSYYNQAAGLTDVADGFGARLQSCRLWQRNGVATVAPQLPVRGYGGFLQAGFPISRWFNADPKAEMPDGQAYFEYGIDAVNATDFYHAKDIGADGGGPIKSTLKAVTVFYKMNPWVQFGFEESNYSSYAVPAISAAISASATPPRSAVSQPATQPTGVQSSVQYSPSNPRTT